MPRTRANGEGTFYLRADGRYEGAIMLPITGGKRKRIRVYGKTRREAQNKLHKAVEQARQGILPLDRKWKVDDYLDYWLEQENRRPLTRRRHESIARLHLKPGLGHYRLDALSVRIIQTFLNDLHAEGKSVATIHQVRKVLSSALTYAMRQELLTRNVARLVELPRYRPKEASHWTLDETIRFLEAARPDPLYPAFALLALYGLRRGEVLGIRWSDVDFGRGILHIRQQVQRINGELQQVELKTDTSERDEPLLATARDVLLRQRWRQRVARNKAGPDWQGAGDADELVFTTRTGRPIESRNLVRSFMRICERHGLPRITIHGLRHSNATAQKELQVHARDTQAILGHGDVRTTGIYEHVDLDSKRNALQKVEDRMFSSAVDGERCRQTCRQEPATIVSTLPELQEKKTPTPVRSVLSLVAPSGLEPETQGSSGLYRPLYGDRLTSINNVVRAHARTWKLGCVAVNIAVNDTPTQQHTERQVA